MESKMSSMDQQPDFSELRNSTQRTLEKNRTHQHALTTYAERLAAELQELDDLVKSISVVDDKDVSHPEIIIPGAKRPTGLVPSHEFLNPNSPFYEESLNRTRYLRETTDHPMKAKDLENLVDAVRGENRRLQALQSQSGQMPGQIIDIERNAEGINWDTVCEKITSDSRSEFKRSPDQYRIKWIGDRHPDINHGHWDQSETQRLNDLVAEAQLQGGGRIDWVDIGRRLGTNRTPLDCMRNSSIRKTQIVWGPDSEKRLKDAVEKYGNNNWNVVARAVSDDVTASQCQGRYQRAIDPTVNRDPWTDEELGHLKDAMHVWGNSWVDVATCLPGRTNELCRERWSEYESATSSRAEWTADDDHALLKYVEELGPQWKLISKKIGNGANNNKCRNRYDKLKRYDDLVKKARLQATGSIPEAPTNPTSSVPGSAFSYTPYPMAPYSTRVPSFHAAVTASTPPPTFGLLHFGAGSWPSQVQPWSLAGSGNSQAASSSESSSGSWEVGRTTEYRIIASPFLTIQHEPRTLSQVEADFNIQDNQNPFQNQECPHPNNQSPTQSQESTPHVDAAPSGTTSATNPEPRKRPRPRPLAKSRSRRESSTAPNQDTQDTLDTPANPVQRRSTKADTTTGAQTPTKKRKIAEAVQLRRSSRKMAHATTSNDNSTPAGKERQSAAGVREADQAGEENGAFGSVVQKPTRKQARPKKK